MRTTSISAFARARSRERLKRVLTQVRRAAAHPQDPEAIHALRVSIRRFGQCLRTFRGLFDPRPAKKMKRRLRGLMDSCGAVRSCDVALVVLRQAGVAPGASAATVSAAREQALAALRLHLKKEGRRKTSDWHKRWHPEVKEGSDWDPGQSLEDNTRRVLPKMAKDFFDAGAASAARAADYPTLHQFRLRAKRFRYALELFRPVYGSEMEQGLETLKGLQNSLGAVNDCVATIGLIREDRRAAAAVRKLLRQREEEFSIYWQAYFPPGKLSWWQSWLGRCRSVIK
jgi:CHAD domain-containing protein